MPITQSRFLNVVTTATTLVQCIKDLITMTESINADISAINSVMDHVDPNTKIALGNTTGTLLIIQERLNTTLKANIEGIGNIIAEQKHFDKVKKSNERAMLYQRRNRQNSASSVANPSGEDSDFALWQEQTHKTWPTQNPEPQGEGRICQALSFTRRHQQTAR